MTTKPTPSAAAMRAAQCIHSIYSDEWWTDVAKQREDYRMFYEPASEERLRIAGLIDSGASLPDLIAELESASLALQEAAKIIAGIGLDGTASLFVHHADRVKQAANKARATGKDL